VRHPVDPLHFRDSQAIFHGLLFFVVVEMHTSLKGSFEIQLQILMRTICARVLLYCIT